ncbi:MAG: acyl carrier protein [Deltaproteobacteria bacterium]|nr:acyl carrier protein [Deltaproteobacteria bacterium]
MAPKEEIKKFIVDELLFGNTALLTGDDQSFLQTGVLDSSGLLELITFIENTFGIAVEDDELVPENLDSLDNVEGFIIRKRGRLNSYDPACSFHSAHP